MFLNPHHLQILVRQWLDEDIGPGDITSLVTIPADLQGKGLIGSKAQGIFAGIPVIEAVFREIDPNVVVEPKVRDGDPLEKGTIIAEIHGTVRSILQAERVALNIIQRLSGIATKTHRLVQAAKQGNPNVRVVDTRKTTPGLRMLEKYAVVVGGGNSHRYGLYDAVLIKDNHIKAAGGLKQAVEMARKAIPHTMTIEVEVENMTMLMEALDAKSDIIMFDNMSIDQMREAVKVIGDKAVTEASGGININNIAEIAALGVDIVSMGSLTYSVESLDISLDLNERKKSDR